MKNNKTAQPCGKYSYTHIICFLSELFENLQIPVDVNTIYDDRVLDKFEKLIPPSYLEFLGIVTQNPENISPYLNDYRMSSYKRSSMIDSLRAYFVRYLVENGYLLSTSVMMKFATITGHKTWKPFKPGAKSWVVPSDQLSLEDI